MRHQKNLPPIMSTNKKLPDHVRRMKAGVIKISRTSLDEARFEKHERLKRKERRHNAILQKAIQQQHQSEEGDKSINIDHQLLHPHRDNLETMTISFLVSLMEQSFFITHEFVYDWSSKIRTQIISNLKTERDDSYATRSSWLQTRGRRIDLTQSDFKTDFISCLAFVMFSPLRMCLEPSGFTLFSGVDFQIYKKDEYIQEGKNKVQQDRNNNNNSNERPSSLVSPTSSSSSSSSSSSTTAALSTSSSSPPDENHESRKEKTLSLPPPPPSMSKSQQPSNYNRDADWFSKIYGTDNSPVDRQDNCSTTPMALEKEVVVVVVVAPTPSTSPISIEVESFYIESEKDKYRRYIQNVHKEIFIEYTTIGNVSAGLLLFIIGQSKRIGHQQGACVEVSVKHASRWKKFFMNAMITEMVKTFRMHMLNAYEQFIVSGRGAHPMFLSPECTIHMIENKIIDHVRLILNHFYTTFRSCFTIQQHVFFLELISPPYHEYTSSRSPLKLYHYDSFIQHIQQTFKNYWTW